MENFQSLEKFQLKYNVHLNYLNYFQLIAAIPNHLKKGAIENVIPDRSILEERDTFHLSDNKTVLLTKMRCKDYYKFFQEKVTTEPTAVKSWSKRGFDLTHHWSKLFQNIYKISIDNKLREFAFKLFHRILVTNKELKRFKIRNDDACFQCQHAD